jgi:EmrB/QacA subfamily drug resistance transporter
MASQSLPRGTKMALVAMGLGVIVIANDFTALNVALPSIESDFDVDVGTVQWVINAYALTFGITIVTGGRLADMFGRRRLFFIGAALFAGFSLLGAAAQDPTWLIGTRVGMGVGGALMWPAILGMTYDALPATRAALAGAIILGAAGLGNAVGPLIGGVLTDELSWRWIFLLNVPIAGFAVLVTALKVPARPGEGAGEGIDYGGVAAISLGLLLFLLGFDQAADWGFGDPRVIAMLGVAIVLIASFGLIEARVGDRALVPAEVIRNTEFRSACIAVLMMSAVFFVSVLYGPQFMQKILGYSALQSGAGMAPMLACFAAVSFAAGNVYDRIGAKATIAIGAVGLAVGPFLLSRLGVTDGYEAMIPGLVATGLGAGLFYSAITTAAVTSLDPSRSSLAGGLVYMFQIAGGAIGLGVTTTIFTLSSESDLDTRAAEEGARLTDHQVSVMHGLLAGTDSAEAAVRQVGDVARERIEEIVRESFVVGIQRGFSFVTVMAVIGFLVAVMFVGGRLHRPGAASDDK